MAASTGNRLFLGLAALLFLGNLLVFNDLATIWDGAETQLLIRILRSEGAGWLLPELLLDPLVGSPLRPFWLRLPAALVLIAALAVFYAIARPIYGLETTVLTLLALGSSFLTPLLGKLATGDAWLFGAHLLGYHALVMFLKLPSGKWRWLFYLLFALGIWIHPLSTLVFYSVIALVLFFLHPNGRRMVSLNPWVAGLVLGGLLYLTGALTPERPGFWLGYGLRPYGEYLLALGIGMLPLTGFWIAGLWDSLRKFRQGEELSQLTFTWLLGALLAQSPVAAALLAFLAGKQLALFFDPRYPHRPIVRTVAILHLVGVFFALLWLMIGGFLEFRGVGFRSGLAFSGAYWIFSFAGVIGMFGMNRRLTIGGVMLSGLLGFLLFWSQLFPLWESRRDLPKRVANTVEAKQPAPPLPVFHDLRRPDDNTELYLRLRFPQAAGRREAPAATGFYVLDTLPRPFERVDTLTGWNDRLQEDTVYVVRLLKGAGESDIQQDQ